MTARLSGARETASHSVRQMKLCRAGYLPLVVDEFGSIASGSDALLSGDAAGSSICDEMAAATCALIGSDSVPEPDFAKRMDCNSSRRVIGCAENRMHAPASGRGRLMSGKRGAAINC